MNFLRAFRMSFLVMAPALVGCDMQTVTLSPEIDGILIIDGSPAANSQVYFGYVRNEKAPCSALPSTRTDANGLFHFASTRARFSNGSMRSGRTDSALNLLCFRFRGELRPDTFRVTQLSDTQGYRLSCRLPVPVDAVAEDRAVCQWGSMGAPSVK